MLFRSPDAEFATATSHSTIYSEYLLYEPLLRIARAQGYMVKCEVAVANSASGKGDKKRLDFVLSKDVELLSIEVKWIKSTKPNIVNDVNKLITYNGAAGASGYVLLFGQARYFKNLVPKAGRQSQTQGKLVSWAPGRTKYSAQWFKYT